MTEQTPAQRADEVYRYYAAKRCSREAAIREIRAVLDVTDLGAAEMLDHPRAPSSRYVAKEWKP
jgi:hypothetical protein